MKNKMQSICVTKTKEYYIIADGIQEYLVYRSREEAESFIELFKPFYKNKDVYFYVAVDEGRNKGVIHNETLFNKNNIKFLLLKKSGKYYKSYFEAEKHLKEDYEYLTGE